MRRRRHDSPIVKISRLVVALIRTYLVSVGILATILFIILMFYANRLMVDRLSPQEFSLREEAVMVINLQGRLIDGYSPDDKVWLKITGNRRDTYLYEVAEALSAAQDDERIKLVLLDIGNVIGDLVTIGRLRAILLDFMSKGKKVVSFLPHADNNRYFLASATTQIVVSPLTGIELPGPVLHLVYLGEALRKLAIGVEVVRSGEFKSAFEMFVRDAPSREARAMYGWLERDLRNYLIEKIAAGRGNTTTEVEQWLQSSLFTVAEAQRQGLVDKVERRHLLLERLKKETGVETKISYRDYLSSLSRPSVGSRGIGLVVASGQIMMTGNEWEHIVVNRFVNELRWMRTNDDVVAVVIRIDSPGGSALASELLWQEIRRLNDDKPVVISMGTRAASGVYYLAVAGNYIFAEPSTITGSIGVVGVVPHLSNFDDEYGVSFYAITQSQRQNYYNLGTKMTDADRQQLARQLDEVYQVFLRRVSEGRAMELEDLNELSGGRVYTGRQAVDNGLVDELGGLQDALNKAKELVEIDPQTRLPLHRYRQRFSLIECLMRTYSIDRCLSTSSYHDNIRQQLLDLLNTNSRIFALWPGFLAQTEAQRLQ